MTPQPLDHTGLGTNRLTAIKITIRIPKQLHAEPVISKLVSQHGVTVNIAAANSKR